METQTKELENLHKEINSRLIEMRQELDSSGQSNADKYGSIAELAEQISPLVNKCEAIDWDEGL